MNGYYDGHPLVHLDRHLALAGLVTADTRRVGQELAALTGLSYLDLERLAEHEAGMSTWEILFEAGFAYYRDLERRTLARALADRPRGVLVLGDATLVDDANRRAVVGETTLVALERDLANCYWRLKTLERSTEPSERAWHPLFPDPLTSIDQVRPFFQERHAALAAARHSIPLAGRPVGDAVRRVMAILSI